MIVSGGANAYPAEVEAAIGQHPDVLSCAVVGVVDEDLGQALHAVVQAPPRLTAQALQAFLVERLVRYKIPRTIDFADQPLRDDAGKVRRNQLTCHDVKRR